MSQIDIDPSAYLGPPRGWWRATRDVRRLLAGRIGLLSLTASAMILGINIGVRERSFTTERAAADIESQLRETHRLAGELALARLTNRRLRTIQEYSTRYSIPAGLAYDIYEISLAEGLEPELAFRLVEVESSFRRTAVSEAGAIGYTQIKPSTAAWLNPRVREAELMNTRTNLRLGFRYLRHLLDQYDDDMRMALLAYNRGPGRLDELISTGRNPDNGYPARVLETE